MKTRIRAVQIGTGYGLETANGNRLQLADGGTPPTNVRLQQFTFRTLGEAQAAAAAWNLELVKQDNRRK